MPYCPETRQYRTFAASNFRCVDADTRDGESQESSYVVRGHYTVFGTEYELFPGFYECVDSRALDDMDTSDVLFQFNHSGTPLARLRNGSLRIGIDDIGGWAEADLSGCQQARDIYEAISNGLIDRMSFGFTIADDGFEWEEDEDGTIHSRITKVEKLYDVSCVDLPASDYTDISARSYVDAAIEAERKAKELASESEEPTEEPVDEQVEEESTETVEETVEEQPEDEQLRAKQRRMRRARAMRLSSL